MYFAVTILILKCYCVYTMPQLFLQAVLIVSYARKIISLKDNLLINSIKSFRLTYFELKWRANWQFGII